MCVTDALKRSFPSLPVEICEMIAPNLTEAYAASQRAVHFSQRRGRVVLSLEKKIWLKRVVLGGSSYVASLSNDDRDIDDTRGGRLLLFDPATSDPSAYIYVASDYLGIRDIVIQRDIPVVDQKLPPWWEVCTLASRGASLTVMQDVREPLLTFWNRQKRGCET